MGGRRPPRRARRRGPAAGSLGRSLEVRRRHPDAEMFMGIGNLTELTEADTTGVTAMLIGFCFATRTARLSMAMKSLRLRRWIFWKLAGWNRTPS